MSYNWTFTGSFAFDRQLAPEHHAYLQRFAKTRRVKRHVDKIALVSDPLREAVDLPLGPEGAYFVASAEEDETVLAWNHAPEGQFDSMWCSWHPSEDGMRLVPAESAGNDSEHSFSGWLRYLLDHFLVPWGYILNGVVYAYGEDPADNCELHLLDNHLHYWAKRPWN